MSNLLFWFLLGQTIAGLPVMGPGTEVRLVSPDLLTVFASGRVEDGVLTFVGQLEPGQRLRLLIFPAEASEQQRAEALSGASALTGNVTADGRDILVSFPDLEEPVPFRDWLVQNRGIGLEMPGAGR